MDRRAGRRRPQEGLDRTYEELKRASAPFDGFAVSCLDRTYEELKQIPDDVAWTIEDYVWIVPMRN